MNPLLEIRNLSKSFFFRGQNILVLKDIGLQVPGQSFISVIGPSGCGKSTLLELIAGITKPDNGVILHQNTDITGKAGYAGYMPQDDLLLPWLSLIDNVILPCRISRKPLKASREKALSLLPDFGLTGFEHHHPWQLSGGMKQRTAFLRTVMTEADILLLDEPFANLDALTRIQMQIWLGGIQTKLKKTIILVTHDIDEAIRLSDTIYVMQKTAGEFVYRVDVPSVLHTPDANPAHPQWSALRTELLGKLLVYNEK